MIMRASAIAAAIISKGHSYRESNCEGRRRVVQREPSRATVCNCLLYPMVNRVSTVSVAISGRYRRYRFDAAAAGIWNSIDPLRDA